LRLDDDAFVKHDAAQGFAEVGIFADPLGNDVARAFQGFVDGCDAKFDIDEGGGEGFERLVSGLLLPEVERQRLESFFAGDGGLGAALGR